MLLAVVAEEDTRTSTGWRGRCRPTCAAPGYCHEALDLQVELGDRDGAADTLDSLGHAYHQLCDHEQARTFCQGAAESFRESGNRPEEGGTIEHLGDVAADAGDLDTARENWRQALELLDQVGPVDAIRAKLDHADRRSALARVNGRDTYGLS